MGESLGTYYLEGSFDYIIYIVDKFVYFYSNWENPK